MDLVASLNSCTLHGTNHIFVEGGSWAAAGPVGSGLVLARGAFLCQVGRSELLITSATHM